MRIFTWRDAASAASLACVTQHEALLQQIDELIDHLLSFERLHAEQLGALDPVVLATLIEVRARLAATVIAEGGAATERAVTSAVSGWDEAETLLGEHTRALFGPGPAGRHAYVMATAPSARSTSASSVDGSSGSSASIASTTS